MKKNIQDAWWQDFVQARLDCVGLDSSIIQSPKGIIRFYTCAVDCSHLWLLVLQCGNPVGTLTTSLTLSLIANLASSVSGAFMSCLLPEWCQYVSCSFFSNIMSSVWQCARVDTLLEDILERKGVADAGTQAVHRNSGALLTTGAYQLVWLGTWNWESWVML